MIKNEAIEHLKNSTLKIEGYNSVGSGFFIAQGLVATCYHVVEGFSASELTLTWQGKTYQATSIESNPNDDLALISLKIKEKHPCVQIDKTIELGDECYSFGYSTKSGDVISFEYEGTDGEGLLKFKGGLFQSGFSGSAVLNLQTLKVCGVVKRTRDSEFPTGGRGIVISKLFSFESLDMDDNGSIFSKEMFKNWVWISSVESVKKSQLSILALVETLVLTVISFSMWLDGIYEHIIIGLIFAPFFFLRTKKSKKEALSFFIQKVDTAYYFTYLLIQSFFILEFFIIVNSDSNESYGILKEILILHLGYLFYLRLPFSLFFGNLLKVVFTLKNLSIKQLLAIPSNWFQITFLIDNRYPLEVIPDITQTNSEYKVDELFKNLVSQIDKRGFLFRYTIGVSMIFGVLFTYIFSKITMFILRYFIKSTAWIYLPLIWLIQPQDKSDLTTRMKIESKNFIAYLMFFYSLIVVFVFTLFPLLFPHTEIGVYLQTLPIPDTLKKIFFAYQFNLWHLTRFLSALITIVFMFSFTKILIRRETNPSYGNFWGAKLLSLRALRSVLTLVTLGFTAYHILQLLPPNFFGDLWGNMRFTR